MTAHRTVAERYSRARRPRAARSAPEGTLLLLEAHVAMDALSPQVHEVHTRQARSANAYSSDFQVSVKSEIVEAESPLALPRNSQGGHEISRREPVKYINVHYLADLRGLARPRRQDRRQERLPNSPISGSERLSLSRGGRVVTALPLAITIRDVAAVRTTADVGSRRTSAYGRCKRRPRSCTDSASSVATSRTISSMTHD